MESVDLTEADGPRRYQALMEMFSHPLCPILPRFKSAHVEMPHGYILTDQLCDDEVNVAAIESRLSNVQIVMLMEQLCVGMAVMQSRCISHGALHESSIFFSNKMQTFVLRGFSCFSTGPGAGDADALWQMFRRMSETHGLGLTDVLSSIKCGDYHTAQLHLNSLKMSLVLFANVCVGQKRQQLATSLIMDTKQMFIPVPMEKNAMMETIDMILGPVANKGDLIIPWFSIINSPGRGIGPTVQIINDFFAYALECNLLYTMPSDGTVWPSSHCTSRFRTVNIFKIIGYLLAFSRCINIPVGINFSPLLIRLIMSNPSEITSMHTAVHNNIAIIKDASRPISNMHKGARPFIDYLNSNAWPIEMMCDPTFFPPQQCVKLLRELRDVFLFDRGTVSEAQRSVFLQWMETVDEKATGLFLKLVTGSNEFNINSREINRIYISVGTSITILACSHVLTVPAYVLETAGSCSVFFKEQLFNEINVFNIF